MTIDGTTVSDVTVTADLRDLTSDNSFRDGRIRSEGLESDQFPEAKFVLTEPITLRAGPDRGRRRSRPRPPASSPCTASPRRDHLARGALGRQAGPGGRQPARSCSATTASPRPPRPRWRRSTTTARWSSSSSSTRAERTARTRRRVNRGHSRRKFGSSPTADAAPMPRPRSDHRAGPEGSKDQRPERLRKEAKP